MRSLCTGAVLLKVVLKKRPAICCARQRTWTCSMMRAATRPMQ